MKINLKQASDMTELFLKANIVPFLHSSPGVGKSDVVRAIATKYNLKLIDLRLSQCDPTDISGLITFKENKCSYAPMDTFPLESDPIPEGYSGWLLFLDEANSAPKAVQAASYKLILDRAVGQHKLHKKVAIVCAGNLETDNAIVESMSTALQSRMCHLDIEVHLNTWLDWAYANNIHYMITSYLQFQPNSLYNFSPDHSDMTFACPRTWSFVNKILKVTADNKQVQLPMLAGAIGEGAAREFLSFIAIEAELPKIAEIVANPKGTKVPNEPSVLFALSGAIAEHCTIDNITDLFKYLERMPIEHQVVSIRKIVKQNRDMLKSKDITSWITRNQNELF